VFPFARLRLGLFEAQMQAADALDQPAAKLLLRTLQRARALALPVEAALAQSALAALQPSKYAHLQVIGEGALIAMDVQLYLGKAKQPLTLSRRALGKSAAHLRGTRKSPPESPEPDAEEMT
jgi:hypothetical protein